MLFFNKVAICDFRTARRRHLVANNPTFSEDQEGGKLKRVKFALVLI